MLAVFVAYIPALRGGFVWDDDAHVTKPALRSLNGLYRIWFELGATQQYYPLLHTSFWLQDKFWGARPLGYHAVNIALHAAAAVLVLLIVRHLLRAIAAPWADAAAALTAAVFVLHPINVESVAWITEQKNTQSAVFYLAALLMYLRFDETRRRLHYLAASGLFVLGLLSKTVTATLPAALLLILWWRHGRAAWRRNVLPVLPWFVLGALGGVFTAWVEHQLIVARGEAFELSLVQRFMLAGRVVWFYIGKLVWPADLIFIYPRWSIDPAEPLQWLYSAGLIGLFALLLMVARRNRGPLAAMLFFVGTLFPVLGFFNVYPFLFSYVADHFQYLASLGVLTLLCSGAAAAVSRVPAVAARSAILIIVPGALGVMTFQQSQQYVDSETLYRATIAKNPSCWMAYNNLGVILKQQGRIQPALEMYGRALELRPQYPEAHNNLGLALAADGRTDEAITAFRKALALRAANPEALGNLANALLSAARAAEAIESATLAVRYDTDNAGLHVILGASYQAAGRSADALVEFRRALAIDPAVPGAREQVELAIAAGQPPDRAIATCMRVLEANPESTAARFALALALSQSDRSAEAIAQYRIVIQSEPTHFEAHCNLAGLLARSGDLSAALPHFETAARLRPESVEMRMNLAVAYTSAGRMGDAIATAQRACELARAAGRTDLAQQIEEWIESRGGRRP